MDDWGPWDDGLGRAHPRHPERPAACPRCGGAVAPAGYRKERTNKGPWRAWLYWQCPRRGCGVITSRRAET